MTVQNTKLSGYNPNRRPSSIPSYLGLPRISSWKKFANLFEPDTPNKLKCDCLCTGRSMVEMLGVLAIVGVLSVGAIAGYSKAMMKYRLNKFSVSFNELLNTCIQYTGQLKSDSVDPSGAQYLSGILHKMNALPDGIKYKDNRYLEDMFGNDVWSYYRPNQQIRSSGLGYRSNISSDLNFEICHQLVNIAKENSSQLWYINIYGNALTAYGDAYCSKDTKCIRSLTLSEIDTLCQCPQDNVCYFYFIWL